MQKIPETLAEQQRTEQITATYLDEPTAWRAAEKIEGDVSRWSALRNERQNLPGFRNAIKRIRLRDHEGMEKRSIESGIESVDHRLLLLNKDNHPICRGVFIIMLKRELQVMACIGWGRVRI